MTTVAYSITALALPDRPGVLGLAPYPGRIDLEADVAAIRAWGAAAVVTLQPADELDVLGIGRLGALVRAAGLDWHHLPIRDLCAPAEEAEAGWDALRDAVLDRLERGDRIVVHCRGGLGRTGTIAASLLVARGLDPESAIALVRHVRPGAIETTDQERWILALSR
jgi:protein-tyrosine phosphatase